jgi:quercetin dioxygenase-like cupin family protein
MARLMSDTAFSALTEVAPQRLTDGAVARALHGERSTLVFVELAAGCALPTHAHDNEQIGILVRGSMRFRIGDDLREVRAGDTWVIPGGVAHEVEETGADGAVVIESFAPGREDWKQLEPLPTQELRWPLDGGS